MNKIDELFEQFRQLLLAGLDPRIEDFLTQTQNGVERQELLDRLLLCIADHRQPKLFCNVDDTNLAAGSVAKDQSQAKNGPTASPVHLNDLSNDKSSIEKTDLPSKQRHDVTIDGEISDIETPSTLAHKATSLRGTFIGPYKLLQEIGQGGMGTVWMAEQEKPLRRRVALKLIKKGQDSEQIVARFEAERQALAMMDHQNIAKVLDAGTTSDGRPFFVMELVSGIPLTKYCDSNKLSVKDRLDLFIPVCSAVQHAHQKGIIHRDLKPSNVLVTLYDGKPVPKVIDFGLAKALQSQSKLTDKTLFTEFGQVVGTLQYMSPEQAEMNALDIDTRTDVYSLGVMLYELLTGSTPIDKETLANEAIFKVLESIREKEPPRPSVRLSSVSQEAASGISDQRRIDATKLKSILRGELDWIVMKALEKDRTRRYETASGLSEELARYLAGDPVQARPPTTGYRIQKYVLKHKGLVASLTTIVGLLVLGIIGTSWFGFIASVQSVRADKKAIEANNEKEQKTVAAAEAIRQKGIAEKKSAEAIESEKKANDEKRKTQLALDESEALLARFKYFLANARWNENRALEANELLYSIPDKYRKFEWYLDRRLYEGSDVTLYGHQGLVLSVTFSPDGQRIASGSIDNTIKLWDAQTGKELQTFYAHEGAVLDVAFSPDGTCLASCDGKEAINLRDSQSGAVLHTFTENGTYLARMAFSCDGKLLGAQAGKDVILWDVQTGVRVRTLSGHREDVRSLAFSADGKLLATGSRDNTIKLWNLETGLELRTLSEHEREVASIAFSPDDSRLLSGSQDTTLKMWDTQSGKCLNTFRGHKRDVTTVAFSPDGERVASGSRDNTIKLWDTRTGTELFSFCGHEREVTCVNFSPDGSRLVSSSYDNTIKLWDLKTGSPSRTFGGHQMGILDMELSPDGSRIASTSADHVIKLRHSQTGDELWSFMDKDFQANDIAISLDGKEIAALSWDEIKVLDAQSGTVLRTMTGNDVRWDLRCLTYSPEGTHFAAGAMNNTIKLLDAQSGAEISLFNGHEREVWSVTFSPDGKHLASGSGDTTVRLWDVQTRTLLHSLRSHHRIVNHVAFSSDGKLLASSSWDQSIKLWDVESGSLILTFLGHQNAVSSVSFSPDGSRLASSSWDHTIKLWDTQSGEELRSLTGHREYVLDVSFLPDNQHLVSSSDKSIKLWDANKEAELQLLSGHQNGVAKVIYSPDCSLIASSSFDGKIKIWDFKTRTELNTLDGHLDRVNEISFSPDGKRLVSGSSDRTIKMWNAHTGALLQSFVGHKYAVINVGFSLDGERIYSSDFESKLVWNAKTGEIIPDADWQLDKSNQTRIKDGRWLIVPLGINVGLVDSQFKNTAEEKVYREVKAKFDPHWHRERADAAEAAEEWYAATFHRAWLMNSDPSQPTAYVLLHDAHEKWLRTQQLNDPIAEGPVANVINTADLLLHPIVRKMLTLPRPQSANSLEN